ncbi:MAG: hypothetical protein QOJ51_5899 [Acidobacteriaceae bacterium]|jgi:hypothetical protein|nr:hypothetical protein [Acidobacteriaceae bacterium]MEA2263074.1 hypothetical protein [Acidobacteriaceae bacterium]
MAPSFWEQRPSGTPVFHSGAQFPTPTGNQPSRQNSTELETPTWQSRTPIRMRSPFCCRNGDGTFTQGTTIF